MNEADWRGTLPPCPRFILAIPFSGAVPQEPISGLGSRCLILEFPLSIRHFLAILSAFSRHFLAIFSPFFNALSIKLDNYSDLQAGIYVMISDGSLYGHWRNVSFPSTRKKKGKMLKEREEEVGEGGEGG